MNSLPNLVLNLGFVKLSALTADDMGISSVGNKILDRNTTWDRDWNDPRLATGAAAGLGGLYGALRGGGGIRSRLGRAAALGVLGGIGGLTGWSMGNLENLQRDAIDRGVKRYHPGLRGYSLPYKSTLVDKGIPINFTPGRGLAVTQPSKLSLDALRRRKRGWEPLTSENLERIAFPQRFANKAWLDTHNWNPLRHGLKPYEDNSDATKYNWGLGRKKSVIENQWLEKNPHISEWKKTL